MVAQPACLARTMQCGKCRMVANLLQGQNHLQRNRWCLKVLELLATAAGTGIIAINLRVTTDDRCNFLLTAMMMKVVEYSGRPAAALLFPVGMASRERRFNSVHPRLGNGRVQPFLASHGVVMEMLPCLLRTLRTASGSAMNIVQRRTATGSHPPRSVRRLRCGSS